VYLSGEEDDWEIDFDFVDPEAQDSISHCADSAGDFIDIAEERHMDLSEFVNALKATQLPELQKLAEDIEKAQANPERAKDPQARQTKAELMKTKPI
jgi:hypothetical protein